MSEALKEIQNIENKYGFFAFRMGLFHLADTGMRYFSDENVKEALEQIERDAAENAEQGRFQVMTPEFQRAIVQCAAELSKFSITDLFAYIGTYFPVK